MMIHLSQFKKRRETNQSETLIDVSSSSIDEFINHDDELAIHTPEHLQQHLTTRTEQDSITPTPLTNPDESTGSLSSTTSSIFTSIHSTITNNISISNRRTSILTTSDIITSAHYDRRASISQLMSQQQEVFNNCMEEQHDDLLQEASHTMEKQQDEQDVSQHASTRITTSSSILTDQSCAEDDTVNRTNSNNHSKSIISTTETITTVEDNLLSTSITSPTIDTNIERKELSTITTEGATTSSCSVNASPSYHDVPSSYSWLLRLLFGMWSILVWLSNFIISMVRASHHMSALDDICSSYDSSSPTSSSCSSSSSNNLLYNESNNTEDVHDFGMWRRIRLETTTNQHASPSKAMAVNQHQKKPHATLSVPYLRDFAHLLKSFSFSSLVNTRINEESNQERRRSKSDPTRHGSRDHQETELSTTSTAPKLPQSKSFSNIEEIRELKKKLELYSFP